MDWGKVFLAEGRAGLEGQGQQGQGESGDLTGGQYGSRGRGDGPCWIREPEAPEGAGKCVLQRVTQHRVQHVLSSLATEI